MALLIEDKDGDTLFTGNLLDASRCLARDGDTVLVKMPVNGIWHAETSGGSWGRARSLETALRYMYGAEFGPVDEHYDEDLLARELEKDD